MENVDWYEDGWEYINKFDPAPVFVPNAQCRNMGTSFIDKYQGV